MGKWAARLAEGTAAPPLLGTDRTDRRGLLSVLAVTPKEGASEFQAMPVAAVDRAPEGPDLAAVAWTDADIARFLDRRARLTRWGWPESDAEKLAERLVKRDREADDRSACIECRHHRPGRCGNHRDAGLHTGEVGHDLAAMLQRCPGFTGPPGGHGDGGGSLPPTLVRGGFEPR